MADAEDTTLPSPPSPPSPLSGINNPIARDAAAFISCTWRPIGCLACLLAIAHACWSTSSDSLLWVAAAAAGVAIAGRSVEKVMK